MPGQGRTGPTGMGSRTGRGMGCCGSNKNVVVDVVEVTSLPEERREDVAVQETAYEAETGVPRGHGCGGMGRGGRGGGGRGRGNSR